MATATRWHFNNETGKTGTCEASAGNCPFLADDQHFNNEADARRAYEKTQNRNMFAVVKNPTKKMTLAEAAEYQATVLDQAHKGRAPISGIDLRRRKAYVEKIIGELVKSNKTTEDMFSSEIFDGQRVYEDSRSRQHEEIVNELIEDAKARGAKQQGRAIFSGGLGGAGKTTVLNGYVNVNPNEYITVNPDDIKEVMAERGLIPKVKGLTPMESSPLAHEEASHISAILLKKVADQNLNIIIDITMSDVKKVQARVNLLRENGYGSVNAVFVDIKPETSAHRADIRYAMGMSQYTESHRGQGGRFLPAHVIDSNKIEDERFNSQNAKNLVTLKQLNVFDETPLVFNNDGEAPAEVSYDEFAGNYDSFLH